MADELWSDEEWRAAMSTAEINDLPDSDFAYIEDGGHKDEDGKTVPRSLRHYPIQDKAHVRNALSRAAAAINGDDAAAKDIAEKAMPAIRAAAKKMGIGGDEHKSVSRPKKPRHRSGPPNGIEVRHFATEGLELRDEGSNTLQLVGTPIVYDTAYSVRDMFGKFSETMRPGVVSDLLANKCDTRFLFNHQGLPLARTTSGTLKLEDTPTGLRCIANLDVRQQLATDLAVAVERGDVTQMSVGMIVGEDEWPDQETRFITKLKALEDVSAVTYPASPTTDIAVAQRMLYEMPVESRERVRRMWAITRDLHDGRPVDPADIDVLSDGLRALAVADDEIEEERAAPTAADSKVAAKQRVAHQAIMDAIHAQMKDPDGATDPADKDVMAQMQTAAKAWLRAMGAQAEDGSPEAAACESCGAPGTPGASFCPNCGERMSPSVLAGPDGTQGENAPDPVGSMDMTGSRSGEPEPPKRTMTAELRRDLLEIEHRRFGRGRSK